jgi:hypothetical protein
VHRPQDRALQAVQGKQKDRAAALSVKRYKKIPANWRGFYKPVYNRVLMVQFLRRTGKDTDSSAPRVTGDMKH